MAKIGNKPKAKLPGSGRRVSPLKPGLSGARNWATAQVRSARYSKQKLRRLVFTGAMLFVFVLWGGLWLGGFTQYISAGMDRMTKESLVKMGFVVKYVEVIGEGQVREEKVRQMLGVQPGDYLFDMNITRAQDRIQSLGWVETAVVRRLWPNRVVVHINERRPYALWQSNQKTNVIDRSGAVVLAADIKEFADLPYVVGVGAAPQAHVIWDLLTQHPDVLRRTQAVVYVGERRWDIVLEDNGGRILLPQDNPAEALQRFDTYNAKHGLLDLDLARIDMRVKGRLILQPNKQSKKNINRKA